MCTLYIFSKNILNRPFIPENYRDTLVKRASLLKKEGYMAQIQTIALVTGANRGLGKKTSRQLACKVILS